MSERGGPTTQSGIFYQNSIAALYLGRLCDQVERSPAQSVVRVRVEAPTAVDDTVVTFEDGHKTFIQAKENIRVGEEAWQKIWSDFARQLNDAEFQQGKDRLLLHCGERSDDLNMLKDMCRRASTMLDPAEMPLRFTEAQQKLLRKIRPFLRSSHTTDESLLLLLSHIDVELYTLDEIERDLVLSWIPESNRKRSELFRLLRDRVSEEARIRGSLTAEDLRASLENESGIVVRRQPSVAELRDHLKMMGKTQHWDEKSHGFFSNC